MKVYINCIAVCGILNKLCHFRTARIKTFEKLKNKSSWKTQTQREQFGAWTVTLNLAKPMYRALLVGDNNIKNVIEYGINQQGLVV